MGLPIDWKIAFCYFIYSSKFKRKSFADCKSSSSDFHFSLQITHISLQYIVWLVLVLFQSLKTTIVSLRMVVDVVKPNSQAWVFDNETHTDVLVVCNYEKKSIFCVNYNSRENSALTSAYSNNITDLLHVSNGHSPQYNALKLMGKKYLFVDGFYSCEIRVFQVGKKIRCVIMQIVIVVFFQTDIPLWYQGRIVWFKSSEGKTVCDNVILFCFFFILFCCCCNSLWYSRGIILFCKDQKIDIVFAQKET